MPGFSDDPWIPVQWSSDANGFATIDLTMDGFGGPRGAARSVAGRSVVVHDNAGNRIACGLITPYANGQADIVNIAGYPGYTGTLDVRGMILEKPTAAGVMFSGIAAGLPPSTSAPWHVHNTVMCQNAGVGHTPDAALMLNGNQFAPASFNPWTYPANVEYTADANGIAIINREMSGFSLDRSGYQGSVGGYALVLRIGSTGTGVACGDQNFVAVAGARRAV